MYITAMFQTVPFDITHCHSFIFLFMYLGDPLYYQSSINLPQTAQTLDFLPMVTLSLSLPEKYKIFHLRWSTITSNYKKSVISNNKYVISLCQFVTSLCLPSPILLALVCSTPPVLCPLLTFVPVSILNLALFCSRLPVALLIVDLFLSH